MRPILALLVLASPAWAMRNPAPPPRALLTGCAVRLLMEEAGETRSTALPDDDTVPCGLPDGPVAFGGSIHDSGVRRR